MENARLLNERREAEEAQAAARRLLRDVLDTVPVRVFWKDRASLYLGCNLPFAKDAGLSRPEELIGKSDLEMIWREQAASYRADDALVMETGIPKLGYEEPQTTAAGGRSWLRTSKIPLKDAAGKIIGVLGTYEDITETQRAEQALRDREQLLTETQRIAHIGSWRWDLAGAFKWTDETYRIYGVSHETFTPTAKSLVSLLHPQDRPAMMRWIEACRAGKAPGDIEFRALRPDGSVRSLSVRGELKYDAENRPAYMAGTVQDITQRKRVEEALQRSEASLRKSQAIGHIGSWELNLATNGLTWSNEVYRIFGLHPHEFGATYEAFLDRVHPEDRAAVEAAYAGSLHEERDMYEMEHRIIRRDTGEVRVVHEKCEHVKDAWGRVVRSVGMVQDITERKRAEALLQSQAKHLEKLVQERTAALQETISELEAFSYTIAHDMRAPLRAILGFAHLLHTRHQKQISETGTEYLSHISDAAHRMDRMIQDVLALSRITRTQLKLEPVDLDKVLRGILHSYPAFQPPHVQIQVHSPLPTVLANEAALTQCVSNLLGNAVKFVAVGLTPRVEVWAEQLSVPLTTEAPPDGGLPFHPALVRPVRLWFADNGIGIAADQQERIFEIFQRVDKSYEGTGIGLAIVRKAMQRMGGKVGLESELGKGSRFFLEFSQANGEKKD
jgi:PAS domain S-box-containing protein